MFDALESFGDLQLVVRSIAFTSIPFFCLFFYFYFYFFFFALLSDGSNAAFVAQLAHMRTQASYER